ncbi:glycosyltransferase [bacterium]|nr:glycosyltransferase [bacterium]
MRLAIIHDWIFQMRGGEKCLERVLELYPESEVFCLFRRSDFQHSEALSPTIRRTRNYVSSLNSVGPLRKFYRFLFPCYPFGMRNLSKQLAQRHEEQPFDAVLSISHCAAKNIKIPSGLKHLCYCLTPMRYAYDQYDRYFGHLRYEPLIRPILRHLRRWDIAGSAGVDRFVAISEFIQRRIQTAYGRNSGLAYPPVETDWLNQQNPAKPEKRQGFLVVNALVPYKNTHIIIEAFNELGLPLKIVGSGPEIRRLLRISGPNITFLEKLKGSDLAHEFKMAEGFVFAAEEDFGMVLVEAQAAGCPIIAYGAGGAVEIVQPGTGILFSCLTPEAIVRAVQELIREKNKGLNSIAEDRSLASALRFNVEQFDQKIQSELSELLQPEQHYQTAVGMR